MNGRLIPWLSHMFRFHGMRRSRKIIKDFKFKNNTDFPIYIMGSASGGILSFRVYGHETREPGREISFESGITDTIEPGEEVVTRGS